MVMCNHANYLIYVDNYYSLIEGFNFALYENCKINTQNTTKANAINSLFYREGQAAKDLKELLVRKALG